MVSEHLEERIAKESRNMFCLDSRNMLSSCFRLGWVELRCIRLVGLSWSPNTLKKELRKKVETYLFYVRMGWITSCKLVLVSDRREEGFAKDSQNMFVLYWDWRGEMDYVVLGWFGISWCQHHDERIANESRSMFGLVGLVGEVVGCFGFALRWE